MSVSVTRTPLLMGVVASCLVLVLVLFGLARRPQQLKRDGKPLATSDELPPVGDKERGQWPLGLRTPTPAKVLSLKDAFAVRLATIDDRSAPLATRLRAVADLVCDASQLPTQERSAVAELALDAGPDIEGQILGLLYNFASPRLLDRARQLAALGTQDGLGACKYLSLQDPDAFASLGKATVERTFLQGDGALRLVAYRLLDACAPLEPAMEAEVAAYLLASFGTEDPAWTHVPGDADSKSRIYLAVLESATNPEATTYFIAQLVVAQASGASDVSRALALVSLRRLTTNSAPAIRSAAERAIAEIAQRHE